MSLTAKELAEILELLEGSRCEEFHLQLGEVALTLRRGGAAKALPAAPPRAREERPSEAAAAGAGGSADPAPAAPATPPAASGSGVTAPMSGTFYRRPSPDEPPFVAEGDEVAVGDPVCVIEVMKLFSTVYAEQAGRVASAPVPDGSPVEQGQLLFVIEPTA